MTWNGLLLCSHFINGWWNSRIHILFLFERTIHVCDQSPEENIHRHDQSSSKSAGQNWNTNASVSSSPRWWDLAISICVYCVFSFLLMFACSFQHKTSPFIQFGATKDTQTELLYTSSSKKSLYAHATILRTYCLIALYPACLMLSLRGKIERHGTKRPRLFGMQNKSDSSMRDDVRWPENAWLPAASIR